MWEECITDDKECVFLVNFCFFFFKQKTAYEIVSRDWSSDVCSSDLEVSGLFVSVSSENGLKNMSRCNFEGKYAHP